MYAAIIGMATSQAAHDIRYALDHKSPWGGGGDDAWDWGDFLKGQTQAGTIGGTLGYVGGAAGGGVGSIFGGAEGTIGGAGGAAAGGVGGATAGTVGGAAGDIGGMTLAEGATGFGGDALGLIGEGVGSAAADAGAATPASIASVIPRDTANVLQIASQGSKPMLKEALGRVAVNALGGAAQDRERPLRGLLSGAASGVASSAVNLGAGALMRGQTGGTFFSNTPVKSFEFKYNADAEPYSLARSSLLSSGGYNAEAPSLNPTRGFSMQPTVQPPGLGGRAINGLAGIGSRAAGGVASMGVRSAMTPRPVVPDTLPWPNQPYWQRGMQ